MLQLSAAKPRLPRVMPRVFARMATTSKSTEGTNLVVFGVGGTEHVRHGAPNRDASSDAAPARCWPNHKLVVLPRLWRRRTTCTPRQLAGFIPSCLRRAAPLDAIGAAPQSMTRMRAGRNCLAPLLLFRCSAGGRCWGRAAPRGPRSRPMAAAPRRAAEDVRRRRGGCARRVSSPAHASSAPPPSWDQESASPPRCLTAPLPVRDPIGNQVRARYLLVNGVT